MSATRFKPMTALQFMDWAVRQEGRYEFDGIAPVAMTGGTTGHSLIAVNIITALRTRLRGTRCSGLGPDAGIRTDGEKVRFPDATVTCTPLSGKDRFVPNPIVVFEVISPDSIRRDHVEKAREYALVPTIRRYAILETERQTLTLLHRASPMEDWSRTVLTARDILDLPEIGLGIPVAELYEDSHVPE